MFKFAPNLNGPITIILIQGSVPLNLIFANQFRWALYNNTLIAPNNNTVPADPAPLNLMFANQFKRIKRVKLKVFILKVANWGPYLTFLWT